MSILCRLGLHSGGVVRDTGCHRYLVCRRCGKREIAERCRYQPIDRKWLETGIWTVVYPPPPTLRPSKPDYEIRNPTVVPERLMPTPKEKP